MNAPGAPGIRPTWTSSAKDMVGTALGPRGFRRSASPLHIQLFPLMKPVGGSMFGCDRGAELQGMSARACMSTGEFPR